MLCSSPRGHHPCGAPYGFEMYYLNVMAGPLRKWRFVAAPEVAWDHGARRLVRENPRHLTPIEGQTDRCLVACVTVVRRLTIAARQSRPNERKIVHETRAADAPIEELLIPRICQKQIRKLVLHGRRKPGRSRVDPAL